MEKGIEFCRKYGILPSKDFKDYGEVDLDDRKVLGF
jgi:hypothetical protein